MKTNRILFLFALTTIFLLSACGGAPAPAPEPQPVAPVAPSPVPAPVEPTQPVAPAPVEPTQPPFAPFCDAAPTGCEAPTVEVIDKAYCIDKVPYAILSVPAGTIYEPLDDELKCVDQLHSDGNLRISCHSVKSRQLWSFDMKLSNGACTAPALQVGTDQCQEGYGYDSANLCCAAPSTGGEDAGSIIYQVDLGACPDPQPK